MTGTPDDLDEYSRIVNALAAAGSAAAQRALLDLLDDPDGNKSTYQRHITLNALGWTRHGAHSDTVDALEKMAFDTFAANAGAHDDIAWVSPIVLASIVHARHQTGHVDAEERERTENLHRRFEAEAQAALDGGHAAERLVVWMQSLGNLGRGNTSLDIIEHYLHEHRPRARGAEASAAGGVTDLEREMVRAAAVLALRQIPGNRSEHLITKHLFDPSHRVRDSAARIFAVPHRAPGEGTAELLRQAADVEENTAVLSLLEEGVDRAEANDQNFFDEVAIPYGKKWKKVFGSEDNGLSLSAEFNRT